MRYVDDCTNVQRLLRVGVVWDRQENKLRVCSNRREADMEKGVTEEQTTARIWREVASSKTKGIKFTVEMPEDHDNGMVPILDVQARLTREDLGVDPDGEMIYQDKVEHKFYKKPTAN